MIIGHECSGIVEEIRREVKDLVSGDRVALEPGISCWRCCQCKQGLVDVLWFRCAFRRTQKYKLEAEFPLESVKKRLEQLEKVKTEKKRPTAVHGGPMPPAKAGRLTNAYVSSFPAPPTFVRSPSHSPYPATRVPQYQVSPPMYGHDSRSPPASHYV
ncbi:hypothetical protein POM88_040537 [Heracleum sosnowskyi]|uniref:Alcohol dehydrogenase-like N-terminal domain-containing protein n=1 Tax=Heracleum sosnowskyi TaxID=360622 RepID=A0AAD8HEA5_9APIA|nr:hypothetical protein POM88_040537 [Heracleum sosnowskyi]